MVDVLALDFLRIVVHRQTLLPMLESLTYCIRGDIAHRYIGRTGRMDQTRQAIDDTVSSDDFAQQNDFDDTLRIGLKDPNDLETQLAVSSQIQSASKDTIAVENLKEEWELALDTPLAAQDELGYEASTFCDVVIDFKNS